MQATENIGLEIANQTDAMLAYWDADLLCRYANNAYASLFGLSREKMVGKIKLPELPGSLFAPFHDNMNAVLNGEVQHFECELPSGTGDTIQLAANYIPDKVDGRVAGFFVHIANISDIRQLEKALQTAEARCSTFLDATPDSLIILDSKGIIEFVNKQGENLFGYAQADFHGQSFEMLIPESKRINAADQWNDTIQELSGSESGMASVFETEVSGSNGYNFPVEVTISTVLFDNKRYYTAAIRNIEKRIRQKRALSERAAIIKSTPDAIISKRLDGTIITWNSGAERILGYSADEVHGQHISLLFPERLLNEEETLLAQIRKGETIEQHETKRVRKDGVEIDVSITLSAIRDKDGTIIGVSKILRDISRQKKNERELRESNERNTIFIEQAPNAIAMFDTDMKYMAASQQWISDYNLKGVEIIGKSHYEIFPEIGEDWKSIHRECLQGSVNKCDEASFQRADGSLQWLQWDVRPWYLSEGVIGGLLMYTADITKRKLEEAERRKTQYILEKSNAIALIASWEVDAITGTANWSRMANEIFELPPETQPTRDQTMNFYKKGEHLDALIAAIRLSTQNGAPYDLEAEIVTAKGKDKWLRIIGESEFRNGKCVRRFGIFQDITKTKEAERRQQKLNDELVTILDSGHVSIIGTTPDGIITHFNRGAEQLLGYTAAEMISINSPAIIHKEDEVVQRGKELTEMFGIEITGFDVFVQMARQGEVESREWTYVRKDGSSFPVQLVISAIKNGEGNITGFLGIATDISDRKKAEIETRSLLELTIEQNKRLKNFAHIVSHNLRSHSGNMRMLIELFSNEHAELANDEYLAMLKTSSDNLTETIANLTEIVKINTSTEDKFELVNLYKQAVNAINNVSQMAANAGVIVENKIDHSVLVSGLPAYIDSVILNLVTNAIKYSATDRTPHVSLSTTTTDAFVVLSVADNGLGIDLAKHGASLFGMYKTFHAHKDARGIGLFITRNQVEAMGGRIEVESEPGKGSTFKVFFKRSKN